MHYARVTSLAQIRPGRARERGHVFVQNLFCTRSNLSSLSAALRTGDDRRREDRLDLFRKLCVLEGESPADGLFNLGADGEVGLLLRLGVRHEDPLSREGRGREPVDVVLVLQRLSLE